jgi:arylformamidase
MILAGPGYYGGMTTILDLTHTIAEGMPAYPGTEPPTLQQANTLEQDGFAEKHIAMGSHTGTHIDAPAHMLAGAPTLDQLEAGHFVGTACVIDVAGQAVIERSVLEAQEDLLEGCDFLLFHTGWSQHWGDARYFADFPVLSLDAAQWLAGRGLKGAGFDAISVDPVGSTAFPNHFVFFRAGMICIENLTGLEALVGMRFLFSCLPLKLAEADGSPVRAVAILA